MVNAEEIGYTLTLLTKKEELLKKHPIADKNQCRLAASRYSDLADEYKNSYSYDAWLRCLEKAYNLDSSEHYLLKVSNAYSYLNRKDKLSKLVPKLVKLEDPRASFVVANYLYSNKQYLECIQILKVLIENPEPQKIKIDSLFLLSKVYDVLKDYQTAFRYAELANELTKNTFSNNHLFLQKVDTYLQKIRRPIDISKGCINGAGKGIGFILGFPRSGTTLLDQILDSNPRISVIEELEILDNDYQEAGANFPKMDSLKKSSDFYIKNILALSEIFPSKESQEVEVLVDKLPLNIIYIDYIRRILPESKLIVIIRDPRDSILSNFFQNYSINEAMFQMLDLANAAKFYLEVMNRYIEYKKHYKESILEIKYEDLVINFEKTSRKICQHLDVKWDKDMQGFYNHAKRKVIKTPSADQVVRPIYTESISKWKNYEDKISTITPMLTPLLKHFNYI